MQISEIFKSIQGEGLRVGEPSLFVRTAGCNLSCVFCDTSRMVNKVEWEGGIVALNKWIQDSIKDDPVSSIVITGGEPLIWGEELVNLVGLIHRDFKGVVNIQTNGLLLDVAKKVGGKIFWSFSPKFISSGTQSMTDKKDVMNMILFLAENWGELKLVISEEDFIYVDEIFGEKSVFQLLENKIVIQPVVSRDINSNGELSNMLNIHSYSGLFNRCLKRYGHLPVRFIPQIHKFLSLK